MFFGTVRENYGVFMNSDLVVLGIILAIAALLAFVAPTGMGMVLGAVIFLVCGIFFILVTGRKSERDTDDRNHNHPAGM